MDQVYGFPSEDRNKIKKQRSSDSDKILKHPVKGNVIPTHDDYIESGWLLRVIPKIDHDSQRYGAIITPFPADAITYTYQKIGKLPEELRATMTASPWQIRKALNQTGHRDAIEAAIEAADQDAKDGWLHATIFERLDPLVVSFGAALGLTDVEIDNLFKLAATL